ncbi:hypothetical protein ACFX2I_032437 [Malus domestica]
MKLTHGSMEELQWRNRASTNWLSCISPKQTPETLSLFPSYNGGTGLQRPPRSEVQEVEEEERSNKWKYFLENVEKSSQSCSPENSDKEELQVEATEQKEKTVSESENSVSDGHSDGEKVAGTGEAVDVGTEEARVNGAPPEPFFPWKLELESLFMVECQGISGERHGKLL